MGATYYVATTGNDSTGDGSSGNPYATPGKALGVAIAAASAGYLINVKTGNYSITSGSSNVAGGILNFSLTGSQTAFNQMRGYTTTPGDGGIFTMTLGAGLNVTPVTTNNVNSYNIIRNLALVGNGTGTSGAILHAGRSNRLINFKVSGYTASGSTHLVTLANNAIIRDFEISGGATGNSAALFISSGTTAMARRGWVHGNAGRGVDTGSTPSALVLEDIASTDHTGTNGWGFYIQSTPEILMRRLVADNNSKSGIYIQSSSATAILELCALTRNSEYGIDNGTGADCVEMDGCTTYGNTTAQYRTTPNVLVNHTVASALPYTGNGNYAMNTSGSSAKGIVYSFPGGGCSSYEDSGAVQHQDVGGIRPLSFSGGFDG